MLSMVEKHTAQVLILQQKLDTLETPSSPSQTAKNIENSVAV